MKYVTVLTMDDDCVLLMGGREGGGGEFHRIGTPFS